MKASLCLEAIGDYDHARARRRPDLPPLHRTPPPPAWCAEIVGFDAQHTFARLFLPAHRDYAHASGNGNRGIRVHYLLDSGRLYEVNAPRTWRHTDRYFCTVTPAGAIARLTREEVFTWLRRLTSAPSASTC